MEAKEAVKKWEHPVQSAIILAGGLGTRLRDTVPDLPKCMAPVAGRPFLAFVIDALRMQGITHFVFSLGYKSEHIKTFLEEQYPTLLYAIVTETEPLGTGGAIKAAISEAKGEQVLVANGDTLFHINLKEMIQLHLQNKAGCTLALKSMEHIERYGLVYPDEKGKVIRFEEKQPVDQGLINGGIYLLDREEFLSREWPEKFSFEKEYLEKEVSNGKIFGSVQSGYFIDIGIPEDFLKAQTDLRSSIPKLSDIDKSWTLFLDRDGVINDERLGEYVLHWDQFIFSSGVLAIFKKLSQKFGRIIIVTNQRGVGKGLMTKEALDSIHYEMQREVGIVGGHIDQIFYDTSMENTSFFRKPNPGMAYLAMQEFPEISPEKSIMVGNKPSDMRFGRAAGLYTVFVTTTNPDHPLPDPDIDFNFPTLADFAAVL
jgi:D-glycero-alpha-D-manno-heptose 1-phosphate guanylyltransferase